MTECRNSCLLVRRGDRQLLIRILMVSIEKVPFVVLPCHDSGNLCQVAPRRQLNWRHVPAAAVRQSVLEIVTRTQIGVLLDAKAKSDVAPR